MITGGEGRWGDTGLEKGSSRFGGHEQSSVPEDDAAGGVDVGSTET